MKWIDLFFHSTFSEVFWNGATLKHGAVEEWYHGKPFDTAVLFLYFHRLPLR